MGLAGAAASTERLDALADTLDAAGHTASVVRFGGPSGKARGARRADLVLLRDIDDPRAALDLVAARRRLGRRTILDLALGDLTVDADGAAALTETATALAHACGYVTTSNRTLQPLLRNVGVQNQAVPALLTRAAIADLRGLRGPRRAPQMTIGWMLGEHGAGARESSAAADALMALLERRTDVSVEVVGAPSSALGALAGHERVSARSEPAAGPADLARWALAIYTPPPLRCSAVFDARQILAAAFAGVPVLVGREADTPPEARHDLVIVPAEDASAWAGVLDPLVDDAAGLASTSASVRRHAESLGGKEAAAAIVERLLGWALYRRASPTDLVGRAIERLRFDVASR